MMTKTMPIVYKNTNAGVLSFDLDSIILGERIIFLDEEITDDTASYLIKQMIYLEQVSNEDITLYINSPGGSVSAGLAIVDTMNFIRCDVSTIVMGMAASMAAVILSNGTKGKRLALPNAEIMIHQPWGGVAGQATEIEITYKEIQKIKETLSQILKQNTGQSYEKIMKDTDRDYYMTANEGLNYGIIDKIISKR